MPKIFVGEEARGTTSRVGRVDLYFPFRSVSNLHHCHDFHVQSYFASIPAGLCRNSAFTTTCSTIIYLITHDEQVEGERVERVHS